MADEKSSFGLIGKAWEAAKIYNGSNIVKYYDGIIDTDSIQTLGDFVKNPANGIETRGISLDTKADDRLLKATIGKMTPTKNLDEVENPHEMYVIHDMHRSRYRNL